MNGMQAHDAHTDMFGGECSKHELSWSSMAVTAGKVSRHPLTARTQYES